VASLEGGAQRKRKRRIRGFYYTNTWRRKKKKKSGASTCPPPSKIEHKLKEGPKPRNRKTGVNKKLLLDTSAVPVTWKSFCRTKARTIPLMFGIQKRSGGYNRKLCRRKKAKRVAFSPLAIKGGAKMHRQMKGRVSDPIPTELRRPEK